MGEVEEQNGGDQVRGIEQLLLDNAEVIPEASFLLKTEPPELPSIEPSSLTIGDPQNNGPSDMLDIWSETGNLSSATGSADRLYEIIGLFDRHDQRVTSFPAEHDEDSIYSVRPSLNTQIVLYRFR